VNQFQFLILKRRFRFGQHKFGVAHAGLRQPDANRHGEMDAA